MPSETQIDDLFREYRSGGNRKDAVHVLGTEMQVETALLGKERL